MCWFSLRVSWLRPKSATDPAAGQGARDRDGGKYSSAHSSILSRPSRLIGSYLLHELSGPAARRIVLAVCTTSGQHAKGSRPVPSDPLPRVQMEAEHGA